LVSYAARVTTARLLRLAGRSGAALLPLALLLRWVTHPRRLRDCWAIIIAAAVLGCFWGVVWTW
jgi:hypothetical protein